MMSNAKVVSKSLSTTSDFSSFSALNMLLVILVQTQIAYNIYPNSVAKLAKQNLALALTQNTGN